MKSAVHTYKDPESWQAFGRRQYTTENQCQREQKISYVGSLFSGWHASNNHVCECRASEHELEHEQEVETATEVYLIRVLCVPI
jgi:hypothetical protein